eukprot:GHVU01197690.1.p3 GENE.GHVU01197690.1~~GHVU01197690.1.p3  ORF type:complete len:168 (+),score=30.02 GHVU01197690.1:340-843(+)
MSDILSIISKSAEAHKRSVDAKRNGPAEIPERDDGDPGKGDAATNRDDKKRRFREEAPSESEKRARRSRWDQSNDPVEQDPERDPSPEGTDEHEKRKKEMKRTAERAALVTAHGRGSQNMLGYIPEEVLNEFAKATSPDTQQEAEKVRPARMLDCDRVSALKVMMDE